MTLRTPIRICIALVFVISSLFATRANAQSVWDGGGVDNNFKTAANWVGDVVPTPGSTLTFDGSSRFNPNNDFLAGTAFSGINFAATAAGPFTITGSSINLTGNIMDSTQSFTQTISLPLALQVTPTINVASFGSLTLGGVISGAFGLNETGNGLLTLSGVNTFTGPISIGSGATLSVANDNNLGAVPGAFSASAISLASGGTFRNSANLTLNANRGVALGAGVATLDTPTGTTLTYNGVVSGAGGFSKLSFGNISLGGANTYTGPTNIKNGTLTLDFTQATAPASNIINSASALTLGGANAGLGNTSNARLTLTGKAGVASSQTFNGTTIDVGPAVIQATSGSGGSATLNLGAISANKGGVANFILPASGNIKTTSSNVNGILGGWATVGTGAAQNNVIQGTDWATVDGSGNIVAYTGYSAWASGTAVSNSFTAASNVQVTNGASLAVAPDGTGTIDINTLALKNTVTDQAISVGVGNTLRFGAVGGIFRQDTGNNVTFYVGETGAGQHNQGTITAGGAPNTPGTLVVTVDANSESSGALRLGAILADNGTGKLTFVKAGAGNLKIDGLNTYTGDSYILQGRVQMTGGENGGTVNPNAFGTGTVFVSPGAYIFPGTFTMTNNLVLAGIGTNAEPIGAMRFGNGTVVTGSVTLSGDARVGGGNGGATGITGKISGPFNFDLGAGSSVASNFTISNPLNDWTGNTTIVARTGGTAGNTQVHLGADEVIPNGIGKGNLIFGINGTTASTMTLDLNGHNETVNGVTIGTGVTAANAFIQNNSATAATLTLGDNNQTATFNGIIQNGTGTVSLTKVGTGVQTLGGANSYTGNTTINNGALSITGSLSGSGNVMVNTSVNSAGALYGGNGATAGSVGNVTLAPATGANKAVINPGATGAGSNGIINVASLTIGAGSNLQFDLGNTTVGNFDQVASAGAVTFSGASTITPSSLTAGSYTIMTGTFSGTAPTLVSGGDTRLTYAFDAASWTNTPSNTSIIVNVSGSVANLTWTGATTNTWDLHTTQNWTSAAPVNPNLFFNGDNVTFDDTGANREIALGSAVAPGNMVFNNSAGDYSVTGGGSIGGVGTLTKSGTSALSLGTANTFSGTVTLNAGLLNINNNSALGSSPALVINGGSLGNTSGAPVTVSGNPAQTWRSDITFNGPNDLNLGTGAVTQDPANLAAGVSRTFTTNGGTLTIGGVISEGAGNNGIIKAGTGTLALTGQNAFSGTTAINAGTLRVGTGTALGGAKVINTTVSAGSGGSTIITLPSVIGLIVGGSVTGAGIPAGAIITAIDTGTNTVTFTGNATASNGNIDVTFGTSAAAVTVASGAALDFGGSTTANSIAIGPHEVSIIGDGVSSSGALTNSSNTNQQNALQVVTLTGNASVGGTGRFDIRGGAALLNLNGFTLTKNGTNQFTVVGGTINQGNIAVNSGTFAIEAASNVLNNNDGTSITVNSNATLQFFSNTGTISRPIILNGTGITVNDGSGALDANNAPPTPTVASNITVGGDITINGVNAASTLILNGTLTETGGSRSITKTGPGKLKLGAATNAISGAWNLNGGLVNFTAAGSLGTGTALNFSGGGLQYGTGVNVDLSSTKTLTFNAGGGTIDTNGNDVTFASGIGNSGTGGFTKTGNGILTLNGASSYTGTTSVTGGTLVLANAASFPTNGALGIGDGIVDVKGNNLTVSALNSVGTGGAGQIGSSTGTNVALNFAGVSSTSTYNGAIVDSVNGGFGQTMSLNVNSGTLILTGSNTNSGPTTIANNATLQVGSGAGGSLGAGNVTNNGTLRFGASSLPFSNVVSGSGRVIQGAGQTSLNSVNTYTGGTRLEGGTLSIGSDAAINNGVGGVTFAGGTLELNNYTSNLAPDNGNVRLGGNSAVLAGPISGTGTFTYVGPGNLKLTGVSTYSGNTTIGAGSLELGGNNRLPSGTNLTIGTTGAILNTGGFSQTFGTLALTGANGATTFDLGTGASVLNFANSSTINWNNSSLLINNWSGSLTGGGTDRILVGTNNYSGLSHAQLNSIQFGVGSGAVLLSTGELVPNMGSPLPLPVRGDLDGNGFVSGPDIAAMLSALTNIAAYQAGHLLSDGDLLATMDVDNNGSINNRDLQPLLNLVLTLGGGSLTAVPEPATLALMAVGGLALIGLRKRNRRAR